MRKSVKDNVYSIKNRCNIISYAAKKIELRDDPTPAEEVVVEHIAELLSAAHSLITLAELNPKLKTLWDEDTTKS